MSSHYDDAMEERSQRALDAHVADELGISREQLTNHPYELDENASEDGLVYNWVIRWRDDPPPGVRAQGSEGSWWNSISILYDPEEPDQP